MHRNSSCSSLTPSGAKSKSVCERIKNRGLGLIIIAALGAISASSLQGDIKIDFQVQPHLINAGQSAVLTWNVKNADGVLISGIGEVAAAGRHQVNPTSPTIYTLIAENSRGVSVKEVQLVVTGGRGSDEYPQDYSLFKYPVSYRRSTTSVVTFLDQLRRVLQDDMTFSVRGPQVEGARYIFITNRSERGYLMQPGDNQNRIGRRRISYLVEVESTRSQPRNIDYTIKSLIEYKKKIESTWRIDDNEQIYRTESARLQSKLVNAR